MVLVVVVAGAVIVADVVVMVFVEYRLRKIWHSMAHDVFLTNFYGVRDWALGFLDTMCCIL